MRLSSMHMDDCVHSREMSCMNEISKRLHGNRKYEWHVVFTRSFSGKYASKLQTWQRNKNRLTVREQRAAMIPLPVVSQNE